MSHLKTLKYFNWFQPKQTVRSKSLHGTPIWNRHYIPVTERSELSGHHTGGWGYEPHEVLSHNTKEHESHGLKKFVSEFIGVMGPFLFPLPYFLAMIPFTIPAIPLALWLDRTNGESPHHEPENSHQPQVTSTNQPTGTTTTCRKIACCLYIYSLINFEISLINSFQNILRLQFRLL